LLFWHVTLSTCYSYIKGLFCVYNVFVCVCVCITDSFNIQPYQQVLDLWSEMCLCVCMCVCMCVYMCVCMYVCMYVCVHVCMYVCMYVKFAVTLKNDTADFSEMLASKTSKRCHNTKDWLFKFCLHDVINVVSMPYHLVRLQLFLWLLNSADSTADNLADIVSKYLLSTVKYIPTH